MKYLVCKKQFGEGCDYTIGCGMRFDYIEALSLEDAANQAIYYTELEGDMALKEVLIVSIENMLTVDLEGMREKVKKEKESKP